MCKYMYNLEKKRGLPPKKLCELGRLDGKRVWSELLNWENSSIFATLKAHGEVQEWLNWPAWKASKRQKRFRGSNPLLSAEMMQSRRLFQVVCFVWCLWLRASPRHCTKPNPPPAFALHLHITWHCLLNVRGLRG